MTITEFDGFVRSFLALDEFARIDRSRNGLQVERTNETITRVAFAVDAAMEVFEAAAQWGADMLFVHHGLFWGNESVLTGHHGRRVRYLMAKDLALYAVHLPLDAHLRHGNNGVMAHKLGLGEVEPFGLYKGLSIGVRGVLPRAAGVDDVLATLFGNRFSPLGILRFGPEEIRTVGIISGGATGEVEQAVEEGLDLYITGDASHTVYHRCREEGINVVFAGHYATEIWGVRSVAEKTAADLGIETTFLDVPTGL